MTETSPQGTVAYDVVDRTRAAIAAELRRLKSGALLDGWRGSPALDVDAVTDIVVALDALIYGAA